MLHPHHILTHHIITHVVLPAIATLALSAAVAQHNLSDSRPTPIQIPKIEGKLPTKGPVK